MQAIKGTNVYYQKKFIIFSGDAYSNDQNVTIIFKSKKKKRKFLLK